jgi:hypothetical protein
MKIMATKTKIHMRINLINYFCVLNKYCRVFKKIMINISLLIYNLCPFFETYTTVAYLYCIRLIREYIGSYELNILCV